MNTRWLSALALAGLLAGAGPVLAQAEKKSTKEIASFGTLRSPTVEAARRPGARLAEGRGQDR